MAARETRTAHTGLDRRLPAKQPIDVRAFNLGERLHLRGLYETPLEHSPLVLPVGARGLAMLFRYGVAVLFNTSEAEQKAYLKELKERIDKPYRRHETEDIRVVVSQTEGVSTEGINLSDLSLPRLQVVATVLARSVTLAWYEATMASSFDMIEPLARQLDRPRASGRILKEVLRRIGGTLLVQQKNYRTRRDRRQTGHPLGTTGTRSPVRAPRRRVRAGRTPGHARPQTRTHRAHRRDHPQFGTEPADVARRVVYRGADRVRGATDFL